MFKIPDLPKNWKKGNLSKLKQNIPEIQSSKSPRNLKSAKNTPINSKKSEKSGHDSDLEILDFPP